MEEGKKFLSISLIFFFLNECQYRRRGDRLDIQSRPSASHMSRRRRREKKSFGQKKKKKKVFKWTLPVSQMQSSFSLSLCVYKKEEERRMHSKSLLIRSNPKWPLKRGGEGSDIFGTRSLLFAIKEFQKWNATALLGGGFLIPPRWWWWWWDFHRKRNNKTLRSFPFNSFFSSSSFS